MAQLSDDLNSEFVDTFKILDPQDSGSISGIQLGLALKAHGIEPDQKIHDLLQSSKLVTFPEYMAIIVTHLTVDSWCRAEIQEVFDVFDKDAHGAITPHQVKRVALRLGEKMTDEEIEQQFLQFEANEELKVEPKGFSKLILSSEDLSTK